MHRGEFGVWEIRLPAKDGQPAIPHNSKVKVGANRLLLQTVPADEYLDIYGDTNVS